MSSGPVLWPGLWLRVQGFTAFSGRDPWERRSVSVETIARRKAEGPEALQVAMLLGLAVLTSLLVRNFFPS